jgi:TIR domain-containing protein/tetratricopeptide repeat protein/NB-ARC domain-containing protein
MLSSDGATSGYRYDVCLSFAGEQRDYVDRVAVFLRRAGTRVFYDDYETVSLWGEDLVHRLDAVYRTQARFCVMFVSSDYARRVWTTHEMRSIQARVIRSAAVYVLPVRFDDTEIPGLLDTVGFLRAADLTPEQLAEFVMAKLAGPGHACDVLPLEYMPRRPSPESPILEDRDVRVITSQLFGLSPTFGRTGLLRKLSTDLRGEVGAENRRPVVRIVTGIGGIGKSSLARAYGTENQDRYNLIWWIRAEEATLVVEDFRSLLVALGVADVQQLEQPVQLAHIMLANRSARWLLVFDNLPEPANLRGMVPSEGAGDIIVTTRSPSWPNPRMVVNVPPLQTESSCALLRQITGDHDDVAAVALADELGGLPLALHQAGSYVVENPIGLAEYLRLYRTYRPRLHQLGSAPDYDFRVGTVWEVSVRMLPEIARTMVNVLAWLGPEAIPLDLLSRRSPIDGVPEAIAQRVDAVFTNEIDYLNAVSTLSAYGLVTLDDRDAHIHRLVQAVTRDNVESPGIADGWAAAAAAVLLSAVPSPPANAERMSAWLRLHPHIQHHLRLTPRSDGVASLRLRHWTAQWTGELGRPYEALAMFAHLIPDEVRVLGEAHPDTSRSRHSQAQWTGEAGDFDAAIALFDTLIAQWNETSGPDHPEALRALHSSAYWVGEADRPAEACDRLEEVLERRSRTLGPEHPDTLRTKHSLAYRTGQTGDHAKACAMLEELLPVRNRVLGTDHPHTLRTRYSLAQSLGRGGKWIRARDLTADLLGDQTRVLGADHPHTLRTRYNLAHWTGMAGDRGGQRRELGRLLGDQNRVLGADHPDTERTRLALEDIE